jgi:ubiquinone/menaquinone biosynthesis C-methylase UbiE
MAASDKDFAGAIPEIYDRYLVPLIFEGFADDIAQRAAALKPAAALETAAGSGVVTRALAPRLGQEARLVVTDLNQAMLDKAAALQPAGAKIEWRQADALALPFGDKSFDVVVCQFGVMFYPDRIAGHREALRVLKPGGSLLFNVWDRLEANDFADAVHRAMAQAFPDDPPGFLARTPYGYFDARRIKDDLEAAGFARVAIETLTMTSRAPSPRHPAIAFCQGTPLRAEIEAKGPGELERATDLAAEAIAQRFGKGAVAGRIQAHVVTATP